VFVVDTNLLLYAVNPDSADHARSRELVEEWRREDRLWFVTWGIMYEFLRVSTHPGVFPEPLKLTQAREWIALLLTSPSAGVLVATERHLDVLTELARLHPRLRGNIIHDLHTAALMKEHGITEIRTADADFHQFNFLNVVNPLEGGVS
jgi:toxin-antitoxin system PIN domain toxin